MVAYTQRADVGQMCGPLTLKLASSVVLQSGRTFSLRLKPSGCEIFRCPIETIATWLARNSTVAGPVLLQLTVNILATEVRTVVSIGSCRIQYIDDVSYWRRRDTVLQFPDPAAHCAGEYVHNGCSRLELVEEALIL